MQTAYQVATAASNGESSLSDFYNLIIRLGKLPFVRFTGKSDDADSLQWSFDYRGRQLTVQYSIYNGISFFSNNGKDEKAVNRLADKLQLTIVQLFHL